MTHLSVLLALQKGEAERSHRDVTALHREAGKPQLYDGLHRTYRPLHEGGVERPSESKQVQALAEDVLGQLAGLLTRTWDLTATRDRTNRDAAADLVVEDDQGRSAVLVRDVSAVHLLWLAKQLDDVHTFVARMPVLDPGERWELEPETGRYRTPAVETISNQKVRKYPVMYEATPEHPAQVDRVDEDVPVGVWSLTKYSGALPWERQRAILDRINRLRDAVKAARERANLAPVVDVKEADVLFRYVLQGSAEWK